MINFLTLWLSSLRGSPIFYLLPGPRSEDAAPPSPGHGDREGWCLGGRLLGTVWGSGVRSALGGGPHGGQRELEILVESIKLH